MLPRHSSQRSHTRRVLAEMAFWEGLPLWVKAIALLVGFVGMAFLRARRDDAREKERAQRARDDDAALHAFVTESARPIPRQLGADARLDDDARQRVLMTLMRAGVASVDLARFSQGTHDQEMLDRYWALALK